MTEFAYYQSSIGYLKIQAANNQIISIHFVDEAITDTFGNDQHPILRQAIAQLDEYFNGKRKQFTFPFELSGTEFQKKVLNQVKEIPFGLTNTYKEIAVKAGNEKAVRAVGNANRQNKLVIVIPCHRVIGSNQKLTGYAGGLWRKEWLIKHENNSTNE